jgi:hypothetical protein
MLSLSKHGGRGLYAPHFDRLNLTPVFHNLRNPEVQTISDSD